MFGILQLLRKYIALYPSFRTSLFTTTCSTRLLVRFLPFNQLYRILRKEAAHERLLRMTRDFKESQNLKTLIRDEEVTELLELYRRASLPVASGERFMLELPFDHKALSFQLPVSYSIGGRGITEWDIQEGDFKAKILSRWCILSTFRSLSLDSILQILSAVLQETQIVVVSKHLDKLSCATYVPSLPGKDLFKPLLAYLFCP